MKYIKYQLYYKNNYYLLKDIKKNSIIYDTITFYSMYCWIVQNKIDFKSISLPRLTLYTFFRDFAYIDCEDRI